MKELILILGLISTVFALSSVSLKQCKSTKACFKSSKTCNIDRCQYIVSWKPVKYNDKAYIEIEMVGHVFTAGGYIAIGFSSDKSMGDDGVVACYANPANSAVDIVVGYNSASPKKNNLMAVTDLDKEFIVKDKDDKYGGSFNSNTKRISCRFLRLATPELNANKMKDLSKGNQYYLLLARGNGVDSGQLMKHVAGTTVVSDTPIDFSSGSFNTVIGSSGLNSKLAKAHGVIMVIVWLLCCSVAIILGRYYKNVWFSKSIEGKWFNAHRGLQGCAYILLIISLILIFVHVGGYSKLEDVPFRVHPILGLISAILFLINPFIALCRCKPNERHRPIFNWFHFCIGTIAYILSIPTIMIGLRLPAAGFVLSQLNYVQWIVFFFVIFQFCIEIILEIHSCLSYDRNQAKRHQYELEVEEYERAAAKLSINQKRPRPPLQTGRTFKLIILGIYILVAILITIILSIIIIVN